MSSQHDARTRDRYAELFEFAPYPYVVTDELGVIEEANVAAQELLGASLERLISRPLATFAVPAEAERWPALLDDLRTATEPRRVQVGIRRADGSERQTELTGTAIADADGTSLRIVLLDVTDVREREADVRVLSDELELREGARAAEVEAERALLEAIVAHVPAGVMLWNVIDERILFANAHARTILGAALDADGAPDLAGTRVFGLDGTPLPRDEWPNRVAAVEGRVAHADMQMERPDGSRVTVSLSAAPVLAPGAPVTAVALVLQDITSVARRERAEREFIANAAHELRTPLTAITGAVEILQGGAKEEPEVRDRFLEHIAREARRLRRLTLALLVLARAQTEVELPRAELVEVERVLRDAAEDQPLGPGVELEVSCPPGLALIANRALVEQALSGLLSNAVRHTSEGRITLSALTVPNGALELSVADTGSGLDPEVAEHAFERFYRGGNRDADGFGLGLSIANAAVAACGGTLRLESEPGQGTTATITLPALARKVGP